MPGPSWQAEADLLADGRELLERLSRSTRYRHLYPKGANLALLLEAYQQLDRLRVTGRFRSLRPWRARRLLRRLVRAAVRRDVLERNRRLQWRYPLPQPRRLLGNPADVVHRALTRVDVDARSDVADMVIAGVDRVSAGSDQSLFDPVHTHERIERGIDQFRTALVYEALAHPDQIPKLHAQLLLFAASAPPSKRKHPIVTLLLVKLPLYFWMSIILLFNVAYLGAFALFNGERLGGFVSDQVSSILDGELRMRSIYWRPRLVVDLVTGRPTPLVVEDVTVYEPYKSVRDRRERIAAHTDRIELSLVLHEIIPWNRLGIPRVFDIPWVLHFADVDAREPIELTVREYETLTNDGERVTLIGLRDAFQLYDFDRVADQRGLSVQVENAVLERGTLTVDFTETTSWGVATAVKDVFFELRFDAPDPDRPEPERLPFRFRVSGLASRGVVAIDEIELPLSGLEIRRFASGYDDVTVADVGVDFTGDVAGSPVGVAGTLHDVFVRPPVPEGVDPATVEPSPPRAAIELITADGGGLVSSVLSQLDIEPDRVDADDRPITARVDGPLDQPTFSLAAEGLAIDALDEPAWVMDDADVGLTIARRPVPERWGAPLDADGADDPERWVAHADTLTGAVLDGTVTLDEGGAHAVFPRPALGEPWLLAADLSLQGINPARLFPDDPDLGARFGGDLDGRLDIGRLVLVPESPTGPGGLRRAELHLHGLRLARDRGPRDDGFPRVLRAQGTVIIDEHGAIDVSGLTVSTDGGQLALTGGLAGDHKTLRSTNLELDVHDGPAFMRAFGLEPYFDRLVAQMMLSGKIGAPHGNEGSLAVTGLGRGRFGRTEETHARMWMEAGTLNVRSHEATLFGGRGSVELELVLSDGNSISSKPRLAARLDLRDVSVAQMLGDDFSGRTDLRVTVGDEEGRPVAFDQLRAHGIARAPELSFGGTSYGNVRAEFDVTREGVVIQELSLPVHRSPSPFHAPTVTVPIGEIQAAGSIGFEDDPSLDLEVVARGVPLDVVARLLGQELPIRGQIASGTRLHVQGTVERPKVEGDVRLLALRAGGVPLGSGELVIASRDVPAEGTIAQHRELRVDGTFSSGKTADELGVASWSLDAVVAIGRRTRKAPPPISARMSARFEELAVARLLAAADKSELKEHIDGRLQGLTARALTCNTGAVLLAECAGRSEDSQSLDIELELDRVWIRDPHQRHRPGDPCRDDETLCSRDPLLATVSWPLVRIERPWHLGTGSTDRATLEIAGSFDLSAAVDEGGPSVCTPGMALPPTSGAGRATVHGEVELAALGPLFEAIGITPARGTLAIDVQVLGRLADPRISGVVESRGSPIELRSTASKIVAELGSLAVAIEDGSVFAEAELRINGEVVHVGRVGGERTFYSFAGPCRGAFQLAANGSVSGALIQSFLPQTMVVSGSVGLDRLLIGGHTAPAVDIDRFHGIASFDDAHALRLELPEGIEPIRTRSGTIEVERCTPRHPCAGERDDGAWAVFVGGKRGATMRRLPADALALDVGTRGRAKTWGTTIVPADFGALDDTQLVVILDDVTYRSYDARGRPKLEAEISTGGIAIEGGDPLRLRGVVDVERSRWLKDALEGASLLRFAEDVEAPEAPPPEIVRSLQLELDVRSTSPLRVDNNIAHGVEARFVARVTGSYDAPEIQGRVDVEPGGTVELPFTSGTFEIQDGRVMLERELADAQVDVLAVRTEPIYIEDVGQRQLTVRLMGPLKAIRWECDVGSYAGETAETQRGCLDYIVFGTGDVQPTPDVQRAGSGGLLSARKGLQVVGNVAEIDVSKRLGESLPRYRTFLPDSYLRLGQLGPELEISTPREWFDFEYGRASLGFGYTRGYPGFLLRANRELHLRLEILEPFTLEMRQSERSYLNQRIIFDPLLQRTIEAVFEFEIPSLR